MPRINPAEPPYEPEIATALERIMPPGVPPLVLFRTMARSPRVFAKMFAGGLIDKGPLSLRQREIVIDRTTAKLGCEYEWGVHVTFFAQQVGFAAEHIAATVMGTLDSDCWTPEEQALIATVDDLVGDHTIGAKTWADLSTCLNEAQILEVIALVGYYHTISFLCRSLELPMESYAARFPIASRQAKIAGSRSEEKT